MILFALANEEQRLGIRTAQKTYRRANELSLDYCFPARLEELLVLEETISRHPEDHVAYYLLGNLLYDRRRHKEAIEAWEKAADREPSFATAWRNLVECPA